VFLEISFRIAAFGTISILLALPSQYALWLLFILKISDIVLYVLRHAVYINNFINIQNIFLELSICPLKVKNKEVAVSI